MLENINFEYVGDMTDRFMCISIEENESDFREKMLCMNEIPGFLPLRIEQSEDEKTYIYRISENVSLREYAADRPITAELLAVLLTEFEKIFIRGKSYAFEQDNFVLHPDAIFLYENRIVNLCYLPGYYRPVREQLCDLITYLLELADVNDQDSIYKIYKTLSLSKEPNCTFKQLIEALCSEVQAEGEAMREYIGAGDLAKGDEKKGQKKEEKQKAKKIIGTSCLVVSFAVLVGFFVLL